MLRVGVVPQFDARKIQHIWQPVLEALEEQTGIDFELVGSPGIPEFERQLMAGEFDLAYMNPYHLLKAHEAQGYVPLVRDVGRSLSGIVVARKDAPVNNVPDLDGKKVAFPAPNALGAALIPRAEFGEHYRIEIEPMYVNSHSSVYLNVVTGQALAGGGVQKTLQAQSAEVRDALKIIYKTREVAPHPVAAHPRLSTDTRENIARAFLHLGADHMHGNLLSGIPIKEAGPATLDDYEPLRQMGLDKYYVQ
ncbi:MAG: phosphate/phosphite/phosphonate ABC transporter substrate-binding protein [Thiohalobacterales bacterium]|nr:phosphate/phosphite/phosphonate ABC transporter substrate-binding protein [Thiohalobacterales bacterium]